MESSLRRMINIWEYNENGVEMLEFKDDKQVCDLHKLSI